MRDISIFLLSVTSLVLVKLVLVKVLLKGADAGARKQGWLQMEEPCLVSLSWLGSPGKHHLLVNTHIFTNTQILCSPRRHACKHTIPARLRLVMIVWWQSHGRSSSWWRIVPAPIFLRFLVFTSSFILHSEDSTVWEMSFSRLELSTSRWRGKSARSKEVKG